MILRWPAWPGLLGVKIQPRALRAEANLDPKRLFFLRGVFERGARGVVGDREHAQFQSHSACEPPDDMFKTGIRCDAIKEKQKNSTRFGKSHNPIKSDSLHAISILREAIGEDNPA